MVNNPNNPNFQLTWQAILWRLLLTLLLLLALGGPGFTLFEIVTTRAETRALPELTQPAEASPSENLGPAD